VAGDGPALAGLNGLAQATGWSGNVGTMASWFHKHERGKMMGVWSTSFTVGALVPGWVIAAVLGIASWPWAFYSGAAVLAVVWVQFYVLQRTRPEDVGVSCRAMRGSTCCWSAGSTSSSS
jgi:OPA family glycerol-3-phosphate transporter-like MFS transporter